MDARTHTNMVMYTLTQCTHTHTVYLCSNYKKLGTFFCYASLELELRSSVKVRVLWGERSMDVSAPLTPISGTELCLDPSSPITTTSGTALSLEA